MSIDAMKQALEALIDLTNEMSDQDFVNQGMDAITALRLAIEQAERIQRAEEAFAAASDGMKGEQAEKQEHAERLSLKGWQYFECPACGSEGARAFPQPEQDTARPIYVAEVTMPDPGVGYD
jgi:hypothetical protein